MSYFHRRKAKYHTMMVSKLQEWKEMKQREAKQDVRLAVLGDEKAMQRAFNRIMALVERATGAAGGSYPKGPKGP